MYAKASWVLVLAVSGCGVLYAKSSAQTSGSKSKPYMDLREPIYLLPEENFWIGCENHPAGYEACRMIRVNRIRKGVNEWLQHFDQPTRPRVIILYWQKNLPVNPRNKIVHLTIKHAYCWGDGIEHPACYVWSRPIPEISFENPTYITSYIMAHEFGHVLGRGRLHSDTLEGIYSVMSYGFRSYVVPVDIDLLCAAHAECPPHENTWCKGGFYDPCRCPSDSFEQGEAKFAAGAITCSPGQDKLWWRKRKTPPAKKQIGIR